MTTGTERTGSLLENGYGQMLGELFGKEAVAVFCRVSEECVLVKGRYVYEKKLCMRFVMLGF